MAFEKSINIFPSWPFLSKLVLNFSTSEIKAHWVNGSLPITTEIWK